MRRNSTRTSGPSSRQGGDVKSALASQISEPQPKQATIVMSVVIKAEIVDGNALRIVQAETVNRQAVNWMCRVGVQIKP